jgi:hypothetical protein
MHQHSVLRIVNRYFRQSSLYRFKFVLYNKRINIIDDLVSKGSVKICPEVFYFQCFPPFP